MLTKRIIPCLDVQNGRVVKNVRFFENHRDAGDPLALAQLYEAQQADELVFYDITATHEGRQLLLDVAARVAEQVMMPLTVGGGVNAVSDFRQLLLAGADKISVNSGAVRRPELIREASDHFGAQCVVLSIDAKRRPGSEGWTVHVGGGRVDTGLDLIEWAQQGQALGAGEICLNVMDADGTRAGFDLEATRAVASAVDLPVIASGGAGRLEDFRDVLLDGETGGRADAALAASVFHFGELTVPQVKTYLRGEGLPVRPEWREA
ncbi:imidazoleglycerol phosphate synthase, cyclase subunit [Deinococcus geothermalis DSM 11300]|uniref:Imidazole glycerol phosphate synthase subunit HisF n=1 Tax=Deinococcus geothermalis (strain DSM 11300 / CIP 105573 / AG-3a) TaxID=319795 RepID=HIS6_DEIGD|nr:imidazole glycerol phosphate synthase subunit HisF [Deinococcus geothermalis]Q1IX39.1 RecName: Full=Imidazole glycerol phosphate synthase subunit HisF; AltName: Full=IGP synthase cyclase subunit; AltName: Full=IGP synthase subunit HisF; AltName: Full=ImGP synthase subunit HisF; Short=IGPS subunit HisF [Deinococcus geothermalis DSM 11300]ABF46195.1 imidazoleglycerol phosphate synthase, cyclase subunit [Deinococcus geothermalis DSM 11300]